MLDALSYGFMQNALVAGLLASLICGVVGTLIVVRRIVFVAGGISHASFGGVGMGLYLSINPVLGALVFSLLSAVGMGAISKYAREREDTAIGMLWAAGMAIGILFIGLTPGYVGDLFGYLFGSILSVPRSDLWLMLLADMLVLSLFVLLFKELLAISFDEEHARVAGVRVALLDLVTLCMIALSVVLLIRIVGIVLAIALLTIPAATAGKFTYDLRMMVVLSTILSALFIVIGLLLSFQLDIPSGATIVLAAIAGYVVSVMIAAAASRGRERAGTG